MKAYIPNWSLVLVGSIASAFAYWTLKTIKAQTNQLSRQTNVLEAQMATVIEKERPRLKLDLRGIEVEEFESEWWDMTAVLEFTNGGESTAHNVDGAVKFIAVPSSVWPLPDPDPEEFSIGTSSIEFRAADPTFLALHIEPDESMERFSCQLEDGTTQIYCYGFFRYSGLKKLWTRYFGYIWTLGESERSAAEVFTDFPIRRPLKSVCPQATGSPI